MEATGGGGEANTANKTGMMNNAERDCVREPASIASEIVSTTISAATAPSFSKKNSSNESYCGRTIKYLSGRRHARTRPQLFHLQPTSVWTVETVARSRVYLTAAALD